MKSTSNEPNEMIGDKMNAYKTSRMPRQNYTSASSENGRKKVELKQLSYPAYSSYHAQMENSVSTSMGMPNLVQSYALGQAYPPTFNKNINQQPPAHNTGYGNPSYYSSYNMNGANNFNNSNNNNNTGKPPMMLYGAMSESNLSANSQRTASLINSKRKSNRKS